VERDRARYYQALGRDYPTTIRQLVPAYDDLVDTLVALLAAAGPDTVLDVGCGEGTLTRRLLERLPGARVTGLDASASMLRRARRRVGSMTDRVDLVEGDIAAWRSEAGYGGACSNLVLHNLEPRVRARALERIREALEPGAPFLWGDLIRFEDPALQEHLVQGRIRHARAAGCDEELIRWNFRKEAEEDHPLTVPQAVEAGREAGFARADPVWMRDTFLLLRLRA